MVEQVVSFDPELQVEALGDLGVLEQSHVVVRKVRQAEQVARAVADVAQEGLRQAEAARVGARRERRSWGRLIADSPGAGLRNGSRSRASLRCRVDRAGITIGADSIGYVTLQSNVVDALYRPGENACRKAGLERENPTHAPAMEEHPGNTLEPVGERNLVKIVEDKTLAQVEFRTCAVGLRICGILEV